MPISAIDDCTVEHWEQVFGIIKEALHTISFEADLVSNADESGIIQERIVRHLAEDPIVVCDVSAKNPNVMFELGLRLALDKPTVVIKDNKTGYSFDTSPLEHLTYPRDLNYHKIQDFKEKLAGKVKATYDKGQQDPNYSTFLKSFVQLKPKHLPVREVEISQVLLEELGSIREELAAIRSQKSNGSSGRASPKYVFGFRGSSEAIDTFIDKVMKMTLPRDFMIERVAQNRISIEAPLQSHRFIQDVRDLGAENGVTYFRGPDPGV